MLNVSRFVYNLVLYKQWPNILDKQLSNIKDTITKVSIFINKGNQ